MVNNSDAVIDKQLISKLMDSFVCICIAGVDCRHSYRGSGCIVSVDDLTANVVTNYHLVETVNKIVDIIGNGWSLLGRVVYVDPKLDLALIKFTNNNKNLITNYQILQSFPSFGDHMLSLGYATNDYNLCTGIIISPASVYLTDHNMSYFYSCSPGMVYIEHCVPIYSGFSGGPLIDVSNGQLCCMNCIVENGSQRFAISGDYINKFLENAHLFRESQQLRRLSEHRAIRLGMHFKWQSRGCYIVTKFLNFDETYMGSE
ncbi:serine protease HTRA1-like [Oppia nitens]|uniref:serine protease HTRA1-like n=1 Tax=Oppia nitens TaxID=1686743 RepID=UPI0023D9C28D|nr:serine protease HTRA1-like [Oppia nitens]